MRNIVEYLSPALRRLARRRRRVAAGVALAGVAGFLKISAAVNTWTNGDGNGSWTDALNWSQHLLPAANDALLFTDVGTSGPLALNGPITAGSLAFDSTHAVTIDGNTSASGLQILTLSSSGANALSGSPGVALSNTTAGSVTLGQADGHGELGLRFTTDATFAVPNAAANLVLGAHTFTTGTKTVVTGTKTSLAGATFTKSGAGTLTVNGELATQGGLVIQAGTVLLNAPTRIAGTTTISGGSLVIADGHALQYSTVTPAAGLQFAAGLGTATFGGLSGAGNLPLQDSGGAPVTLQVAAKPGTYSGDLSGAGGLTRIGANHPAGFLPSATALLLTGANTYTGATTLSGATPITTLSGGSLDPNQLNSLVLDFTAAGAPLTNIISASSPLVLGGPALSSGGSLEIRATSGRANGQTFAGTTVREGASFLYALQNGSTGLSVALGSLNRQGGTLDVTLTSTPITATATLNNGILGGWATTSSTARGGYENWATITNGKLAAYTGYTGLPGGAIPSAPAANYSWSAFSTDLTFGAGGTTTDLNTIRVTNSFPAAKISATTDSGVLRFGPLGGILYTGSLGSTGLSIGTAVGNGRVTAGGADNTPGELFLVVSKAGFVGNSASVAVNSAIVDNGTGVVSVSKSGLGAVSINNPANRYTGGTVVDAGRIDAGTAVGAFGHNAAGTAGGDVIVKAGGQVHLTGGTWDNRFSISGTGTTNQLFSPGAIWLQGATLAGEVHLTTNAQIGNSGSIPGVVSGLVTGDGALLSIGGTPISGAFAPAIFTNPSNSFTGGIGTTGGVLAFTSPGAMGNDTRRNVLMNGGAIALTFAGVQPVLQQRFALDAAGTLAIGVENSGENIDLSATGANLPGLYLGATGTVTYTGTYVPDAGVYHIGGGGGVLSYARDITGSASVVFGGSGGGTATLTGHNTYTGGTSFNAGFALFGDVSEFGNGPLAFNGGTLRFAPGNTSDFSTRTTTLLGDATLDLGANNVTLAHPIGGGGSGGLTKTGTGALTLNAPNDYTGQTTIDDGTVVANAPGALPRLSRVEMFNSSPTVTTLVLGADQSIGSLNTGFPFEVGAARVALGGHRFTFGADNQTARIYAAIQGSGQLVKIGSGTTSFYNGVPADGPVTDFNGSLAVNGGKFVLTYDNFFFTNPVYLLPIGTALSLGGGTLGISGAGSQVFAGTAITPGAGGISTAGGPSTVDLGPLTRSGAGGTLDFAVIDGSSVSTRTANTGGTIVGGWATFGGDQFAVSGGNGTNPGLISGLASGGGSFATGGDVDTSGSSTATSTTINSLRFNGAVVSSLNAASGLTIRTGGILLVPLSLDVAINNGTVTSGNGADLIVTNNSSSRTLTINSKITGAIGLTKSGAGTLAVSNAGNDFTGPVTLNAGTLQVLASGALGSNPVTINGSSGKTAQLQLASGVTLNNPIAVNGPNAPSGQGVIAALGPVTLNGAITITSDVPPASGTSTFSGPLTLNGPIQAPAGVVLSSQAGAVVFAGGGNYTGFTIMSGTNSLGAANGMSTAARLDLGTTADAALELNGFNQTFCGLTKSSASWTGTILNSSLTSATLTLNVPAGRVETSSIVLAGKLGLVKEGAGAQTLTGLHTYSQPTNVNAGTLAIDGSLAGSAILVNNGGTIAGSGTVQQLTIESGGTLAPGDGPGILHTGNLQLQLGAHFALELASPSTSDAVSVTGSVTLAGDVQFTLLPNFASGIGDKFFLVLNDGTDLISGAFSNEHDGLVTDGAGNVFAINYADNADAGVVANDISLTVVAIPEPSSLTLLGGAGLLAGLRCFRARRRG